jgi:hypothetical protein
VSQCRAKVDNRNVPPSPNHRHSHEIIRLALRLYSHILGVLGG